MHGPRVRRLKTCFVGLASTGFSSVPCRTCPHCAAVRLYLFRPDPRAILRYSWSRLLHRLTSLMPRRSNNKPPNIPHSSGGHPGGYSWVQRERPAKSSDHQQIKIDVPGLFFVALLVVFVLWPGQGCRTKPFLPHRATCHGLAAEIDNTRS